MLLGHNWYGYNLLKSKHECGSSDTRWGSLIASPEDCSTECSQKAGCKYFVFNNDDYLHHCKWENTNDASCPEGWKAGGYDFYELRGKFCHKRIYAPTTK